jgi:FkbM family methyltransferase
LANSLHRALSKIRSLRVIDQRRLPALPERLHLRKLLDYLDVDCVFDVGANAGQYAIMLRRHAGFRGQIISFEPAPETAALLQDKARHDKRWEVHACALADVAGVRSFNIMANSEFSSLSAPSESETSLFADLNRKISAVSVNVETLDGIFRELQARHGFRRPFLKMDTQGFDLSVLRGARDCISQFVGLQSELAIRKIYSEATDFRDALTFYEELGFTLSALVPNNGGHFPALVEMDCIMARRDLMEPALLAHPRPLRVNSPPPQKQRTATESPTA